MRTRSRDVRRTIGGLSAALVLVLACSRSAEQNNFLGKPCNGEGDCSTELVCFANVCREPCGPGGTCDEGYVCQVGACVPGGAADGPGGSVDGGRTTPGTGGSPSSGGEEEPGAGATDGQVVLSAFVDPSGAGGIAADDTFGSYIEETTDVFGQRTRKLMAVAYGASTPAEVYTFAEAEETPMEMLSLNGIVYFVLRNENPNASLVAINLATKEKKTIGACESAITRVGTRIAFTQGKNLRLYDTTGTGALDATSYGSISDVGAKHMLLSLEGNKLSWLDRDVSSFVVKQAALGSPGAATGRTFPGTATIEGFAAVGNDGIIIINSGGSSPVLKFKLNDNVAATAAGTVEIARDVLGEDGHLFLVDTIDHGLGGSKVTRLAVDGTKTTFGTAENVTAMFMTPSAFYATVSTGSATKARLYKWAKP